MAPHHPILLLLLLLIIIIIVIITDGTISKSVRQYLSSLQRKHEIKEMKNRAILGTAHMIRKVLL
jgi:hypothetical protein